jgi:hypothetical protein
MGSTLSTMHRPAVARAAAVVASASLPLHTLLLTIGSLPLPTRHNCTG